jgi:hypothetical protein
MTISANARWFSFMPEGVGLHLHPFRLQIVLEVIMVMLSVISLLYHIDYDVVSMLIDRLEL